MFENYRDFELFMAKLSEDKLIKLYNPQTSSKEYYSNKKKDHADYLLVLLFIALYIGDKLFENENIKIFLTKNSHYNYTLRIMNFNNFLIKIVKYEAEDKYYMNFLLEEILDGKDENIFYISITDQNIEISIKDRCEIMKLTSEIYEKFKSEVT